MTQLLSVVDTRKKFCRSLKRSLWYGVSDIASDLVGRNAGELRLRRDEFLAVNDVSFDVRPGESVALIGRNGAGKSTLLKMINGLFSPDGGHISVRGRIAALIELGAGFNPVLTGRENIYVNAAVLGMKKREVDRRLDEIIDFAELDSFIDMPLKSYSSGMRVRLGFAVASQLEPDLLLIDEVLAVGDAAFRAKCHRRLSQLLENGTAFLLVSHNHHTLLATCSRGIVLNNGEMIADDDIAVALQTYDRTINVFAHDSKPMTSTKQLGDTGLKIRGLFFRDDNGNRIREPQTGRCIDLCIEVEANRPMEDLYPAVVVRDSMHGASPTFALSSNQDDVWYSVNTGLQELRLRFHAFPFTPGQYVAKFSICQKPMYMLDSIEAFMFGVDIGLPAGDSLFYCERTWLSSSCESLVSNSSK